MVGARRNDKIAEILTIDADGDLHTGRRLGEIAQPFGRVTFGRGLDKAFRFPVAGPIDANVAQILETIEQHRKTRAGVRRPLQALDGGFYELPGEPHDALVLRVDAGAGADDHHQHERDEGERKQCHEQGVQTEADGHARALRKARWRQIQGSNSRLSRADGI